MYLVPRLLILAKMLYHEYFMIKINFNFVDKFSLNNEIDYKTLIDS